MIYALHETAYGLAAPLRFGARLSRDFWTSSLNPARGTELGRTAFASADVVAGMTHRYGKPAWRIDDVFVRGHRVAVSCETVWRTPWVRLRRFRRDPDQLDDAGAPEQAPPVLIVAPLSGHYATLLRGTVQTFLTGADVYVTDWSNARDVPVLDGRFGLSDFIDTLGGALRQIGRRAHVVAVCQPGPAALAQAALMAEDGDPLRPASLTLMGSPVDARLSPTRVNDLAAAKPFAWFASTMIETVPPPWLGSLRRVYPGFVQLYSFMSMNADRHREAHRRYFGNLVRGDGDSADRHREFYDEYLSVLDLTEEFYLETIDQVFQRHLLPQGLFEHRGRRVDLSAIRDIALMTVEGANDDISGVGQTQAAHALCPNVPQALRELYVHPEVGHYGVFNGRRFEEDIHPRIADFIARAEEAL